jgi:glycosyltransferase involved in cell wall biosynthesis
MSGTTLTFSIVVPTHNRLNLLKNCVNSLANQDFPPNAFEIIIVNDASDDATPSFLNDFMATPCISIKVINNSQRLGHAASRNNGFSIAQGEFIASTDDDCVVPRTWLKTLHAHFIQNDSIGAVGGSVVMRSSNQYCRAEYLLNFSSWFPQGKIRSVTNIPTCNIAYRRSSIQGHHFDEDSIEIGYRDSLFNYHLILKGEKIIFDPGICITHHGATSAPAFFRKQKRFAVGFAIRGHIVHGRWGKTLLRYPEIHYLHLVFVLARCLGNRLCLTYWGTVAGLLFAGEKFRIKTIRAVKGSRS